MGIFPRAVSVMSAGTALSPSSHGARVGLLPALVGAQNPTRRSIGSCFSNHFFTMNMSVVPGSAGSLDGRPGDCKNLRTAGGHGLGGVPSIHGLRRISQLFNRDCQLQLATQTCSVTTCIPIPCTAITGLTPLAWTSPRAPSRPRTLTEVTRRFPNPVRSSMPVR